MAIQPPYQIFVDFCTLVTSKTQPDVKTMHPSVPTSLNHKKWIYDLNDVHELLQEFDSKNLHEEILLKHNSVRTNEGDNILSSGLKILNILNLYMYIMLDDFE